MTLSVDIHHKLGMFSLDAAFTADGGVTALFGRSGSGKTSIIRIIAGLTRPDRGRVVFDGTVLADIAKGILVPGHRRRFGYVFQDARLFPHMTVSQNLDYGHWFAPKPERSKNRDPIVEMLDIGNLLHRRPGALSGGEKQRVAIGRALLSAPRMLLMDEPLASLDEARKAEILPYLERLRDETKIPIIYVSHSIAEVARLASRVVVMRDGKIEATGLAIEVLSQPSGTQTFDRREAGVLLEGKVESASELHRLSVVALKAARMSVPGITHAIGKKVRVHIPARDVMLATIEPAGLSALNILQGHISWIGDATDGMMEVQIDCGGDAILSRITQLSCERLALEVGKSVYAIIKTVALEP
ncbi:molybdenum ABC transporter ATP-binding protein [Rhizobium tubonense]|uniref:Molybdenum ABC transporter ATP-binding protein n=1 Tax=Rhizobium tubonense TaxID=484088 RepID=A0A2W4ECC1_9HYPH|nr:molybdenum ABC transporter ATP-binding protein [Rhizobium tubonense]PZM09733.1 molybdenum ABC transporter ATP-binding protein [Rhizobium tubonense]